MHMYIASHGSQQAFSDIQKSRIHGGINQDFIDGTKADALNYNLISHLEE